MGSLTSQLMTSEQELAAVRDQLRQTEKQHQQAENKWKTDNDRLQVSQARFPLAELTGPVDVPVNSASRNARLAELTGTSTGPVNSASGNRA